VDDNSSPVSSDPLAVALGRQIAAERVAKGMSQEELGAAIGGAHKNTVYRYETAQRELSYGIIRRISAALGIKPSVLFLAAEARAERDAVAQREQVGQG
jgi:transcriptional regulator with XRE-family HTH domain